MNQNSRRRCRTGRIALSIVLGICLTSFAWSVEAGIATETAFVASGTIRLSLAECVALSVRRNTTIRLAYLDRVLEKFVYITDTSFAFRPNTSVGISATRSGTGVKDAGRSSSHSDQMSTAAQIRQRLPTGAQIGVLWQPWSRTLDRRSANEVSTDSNARQQSWSVNLTQPLLKGGGARVATIDVRRTRIHEQINVLQLKQTVMDTVTGVIKAYRVLLKARWDVEINRTSLERAQTLLETNRLLIELGKMAAQEIIQSEADVADKELALEVAVNAYDRARLDLLRLLDLSKFLQIVPDDEIESPPFTFDENRVLALARENQPFFLTTRLDVDLAELDLIAARNSMKPDLSLTGSYGSSQVNGLPALDSRNTEWGVGLTLDVPTYGLDRRELRAGLIGAETGAKKAALNLRKLSDNLELECIDSVRQIRTLEKQITLAAKARELSERKLAVEQEKLKAGRSTNFQIVAYQDDLRNAKISELSARISYLDALSDLDVFMGTMTSTWGIDLNDRAPTEGPTSASEPVSLRFSEPETSITTTATGTGDDIGGTAPASVTLFFTDVPEPLTDSASESELPGMELPDIEAFRPDEIPEIQETASQTEVSR